MQRRQADLTAIGPVRGRTAHRIAHIGIDRAVEISPLGTERIIARSIQCRAGLPPAVLPDHDVLVVPTSQVPPFPADQEFPSEINGHPMATYLDWMRSAYVITVTGCPAISLPAGHTDDGLPIGVQVVAPFGADLRLLEIAAAVEGLGLAA